jgi:hypothetical protein
MKNDTNIYSAVFFDNGLHMTWDFHPGSCVLPDGIKDGNEQIVTLYANIHSQVVGCYACYIKLGEKKIYEQLDNKNPLHITLYTGKDTDGSKLPPSEAGTYLRSMRLALPKGITPTGYSPLYALYHWKGEWGFYTV